MGDYLAALWAAHQAMLLIAGGVALIGIVYFAFREPLGFWLMDMGYAFPFVGKVARYGRQPPTPANEPGWLTTERNLCSDYRKHIDPIAAEQFERYSLYLKKAYDHGRKPLPGWVVLLLGVLLIAEGLGFSYLLATWMAREGSQYVQTWLMGAIVLVLCVVLMWVMHAAGHQLFRTNLLRSCFREFREERGTNFPSTPIGLNQDQTADDRDPHYVACANRVIRQPGDRGSYWWSAVAALAIVTIASLSTYMRVSNFRHEQIEATTMASAATSGNPFGLPDEVTAPQRAADAKADEGAQEATRHEGMAAFAMLAFIFVITQVVAISAGFKYGFGGNESEEAFKGTRGFPDYDTYIGWFGDRIRLAEARLEALQHLAKERARHPLDLTKQFTDFLEENPISAAAQRRRQAAATPRPFAAALGEAGGRDAIRAAEPAATASPVRDAAPGATPPSEKGDRVRAALADLDILADRDAKMTFLRSLPVDLADSVSVELKRRKDAVTAERESRWNEVL